MNSLSMNEVCPICKENFEGRLKDHLRDFHFMSIQTLLEMDIPERALLTYLDPEYFRYEIRDWGTRNFEYEQTKAHLLASQHDFHTQLLGDRYLQMYICDKIYPSITMTHKYSDFVKVLKELKPLDRNRLWLIDFIPGYPKNICSENVKGLRIVDIENCFKTFSDEEYISVGEHRLFLPEYIPYDHRHHSQFNILNPASKTKNKRLRLRDKCIKIVGGHLFRMEGPEDISKSDITIMKLMLMRNKTFMRALMTIMEELARLVGTLRDGIFLRNTVTFDKKNPLRVSVGWTKEENNDYINLSVL